MIKNKQAVGLLSQIYGWVGYFFEVTFVSITNINLTICIEWYQIDTQIIHSKSGFSFFVKFKPKGSRFRGSTMCVFLPEEKKTSFLIDFYRFEIDFTIITNFVCASTVSSHYYIWYFFVLFLLVLIFFLIYFFILFSSCNISTNVSTYRYSAQSLNNMQLHMAKRIER